MPGYLLDTCHVPAPGEPENVWWFGFASEHLFDLAQGRAARMKQVYAGKVCDHDSPKEVYRDPSYVCAHAERLAEQLAALA